MLRVAMTALGLIGLATASSAQRGAAQMLDRAALGVAAYEATKDSCLYAPAVGPAIAQIESFYARSFPFEWRQALREAEGGLNALSNSALFLDQAERSRTASPPGSSRQAPPLDSCKAPGIAVGDGLTTIMVAGRADMAVLAEAQRLAEGGGRSRGTIAARPAPLPSEPAVIPRIRKNYPYVDARQSLLGEGWTPVRSLKSNGCGAAKPCAYPEAESCAGTGMAECIFIWKRDEIIMRVDTVDDPPLIVSTSEVGSRTAGKRVEAEAGGPGSLTTIPPDTKCCWYEANACVFRLPAAQTCPTIRRP